MSSIAAAVEKILVVRDFSGGPNVRDAQPELGANEAVDAWNVTFDQRGGVSSRRGYIKVNATAFSGGVVKNVFYSGVLGNYITQAGAVLYLGATNTARKTFSTAARVGICEMAGKICVIHPVDGLWHSTDGLTYTVAADGDAPVTGYTTVFPWQNKLWVAGAGTRVVWSAAGDPTAWAPADFVDVREGNDDACVALAGASGIDISGRPGLLVFKRRSTHRIFDSATGGYETVDANVGACSSLSVTSINNRTVFVSERGIFETVGVGAAKKVSQRLDPLFTPEQINYAQLDLACAGRRQSRAHFSLPLAGSSTNSIALEYDPEVGWIAPGSHAMSCYASFASSTSKLYGGHPVTSGRVYELFSGGTDDGTAIAWRFQTKWFEPAQGFLMKLWRLRIQGRGSGTVDARHDYETKIGEAAGFAMGTTTALQYDIGLLYDAGLQYVTAISQDEAEVLLNTLCKAISFRFTGSSSTSDNREALLGQGTGPEQGAFSLFGLQLIYVPLTPA